MSFQIINTKNNKPIFLNDLDKEAAELWGKEVHIKQYAHPYFSEDGNEKFWWLSNNWFDVIGWAIHSSRATSWKKVEACLIYDVFDGDSENEVVKPHLELIKHWKEKGYLPKHVK